eukprot:CAMPEP_0177637828 /NCGR_PEP_ID=MMETSP0447-20121125/5171_1 /TAXON_ID=0 /ORGANISM="Stygamoeba regulata, Strain BSH-02190019" /LENGTH=138 /DNA_ID=CAMNT_0019139765 /DNA_START=859 /DNA_END=1275 /DNA_ORIENTATION=-
MCILTREQGRCGPLQLRHVLPEDGRQTAAAALLFHALVEVEIRQGVHHTPLMMDLDQPNYHVAPQQCGHWEEAPRCGRFNPLWIPREAHQELFIFPKQCQGFVHSIFLAYYWVIPKVPLQQLPGVWFFCHVNKAAHRA